MRLNTLRPAEGSKKVSKRLGRGIGSGRGKTCGHGHKGQKARAGGYHRNWFEGGQTPLHMRLPKFGFSTTKSRITSEIRLSELSKLKEDKIDWEVLRKSGLINAKIKRVKVIKDQPIEKVIILVNIPTTQGARDAIVAAGGKVEERNG
ncbi:MAG: 50S ribosomal protein L15 [Gammaproteobacteria bacterium]|nr:50S ribosomal protein L15 [Gammaproteobacteria bacterium]